jgi:hypothetical protein
MLDPHREIQTLVDNFVADLSNLAKRLAIEQLKAAFGTGAKLVAPPPPGAAAAPARPGRSRRGPHEIEALRTKLLATIAEQPGRRAEDINTALGTSTAQIAQPLRGLIEAQLVRTEGARRGTRYFVVGPPDHQNGRRAAEAAASADEAPA